jgi:DNA-binding NarL/FixJ family response regulator
MNIRILLVDDHKLVRVGLCMVLEQDSSIQIVGEAVDGATAIELAHRLHPDVVLMDIQLPGLNGVEATRRIVHDLPHVKVIMLTMYREENQALEALRVGAMGYLHKDAEPQEVLDMIRAVAGGDAVLSPQLAARVLITLQESVGRNPVRSGSAGVHLTEREVALLRLVAQGLSNKKIGEVLGISGSRVRNQLSEVYRKIQVADRTQAALYAAQQGWL